MKKEDGRYVMRIQHGNGYEKLLRPTQHEKCNEASLGMVKRDMKKWLLRN